MMMNKDKENILCHLHNLETTIDDVADKGEKVAHDNHLLIKWIKEKDTKHTFDKYCESLLDATKRTEKQTSESRDDLRRIKDFTLWVRNIEDEDLLSKINLLIQILFKE